MKKTILLAVAILSLGLAACQQEQKAPAQKNVQAEKAAAAANSIVFAENPEIDNIKRRLQMGANPGQIGFVLLMNEAGQPIMYEGVKGKITSGSKRLTRPYDVRKLDCGQYLCDKDLVSPSDEGTYGTSGEYIFYWNTNGEYRQWNGKYLYSDKGFRTRVEPLVITVDNK